MSSLLRVILLGWVLGLVLAGTAAAQVFRWPEEPENVTALPASVKGRALGGIMRDFATSLGVRCQHCHAAKDGQELDPSDLMTFDFSSDAKPAKEKARTMIRMVRAINENHLEPLGTERLRVQCVTCHRGQAQPRQLGDVLTELIETAGVEAAVEEYHALRAEHYGGFAYDFSPGVLGRVGEALVGQGELDAAIGILTLENEQNPEFAYGFFLSATAFEKAGRLDDAIARMKTAVELAPAGQKPFLERALRELEERE